ncbi:MAG: SsrA-binding protein SmpB [Endomicrobia bacterium]|nr:SsrA-binding protein SmpB [Endomicrobiia bacterium]MCL2144852.1 SsrA-binding protein SmpB [Endomicrobiia bacterium]
MEKKVFTTNRKAFHDYEILEKAEAGIVLSGFEVKSVRRSNVSLVDAIVRFSSGEAYVDNMFIAPYERMSSHVLDYDAKRKRKLLLHKSEINKLNAKVKEKGLTVIPLEVYLSQRGIIKMLVGLAKGKRSYDKKESIKRKDMDRDMARERAER